MTLLERMDRLPMTGLHKAIWLVCTLAWFFDGYEQGSPGSILPFAFQEFHLTAFTSGLILSAAGLGVLIGSYTFSYMADRVGRRLIFQIDLLVYSIFSGLRIFSTGWIDMLIYTLIAHLGVSGMYAVDNAYLAEFLPPKNRGKWQGAMGASIIPGFMVSTLLMLVVPAVPTLGGLPFGWRVIPLIGFFPALLLFFARRTLPESVRFLLSRGKVEEAAKIVEKLEASAGPNYHYEGPPITPTLAHVGKANPKLFFTKPYIFYTISMWLGFMGLMFVSSTSYFLPTIFMMGLGGGVTGLMATVVIQQCINGSRLVSRVFTTLTIDRIGRRWNMMLGCAIPAIGMVTWAYPWVHRAEVPFLFLIVPAILSMWVDSWQVGFIVSCSELYPIEARSMAYGWSTGVGRIATTLSPLFMVALLANIEIFFYSIAALWLVVLVTTAKWIPETRRQTIEVSSKDSVFK